MRGDFPLRMETMPKLMLQIVCCRAHQEVICETVVQMSRWIWSLILVCALVMFAVVSCVSIFLWTKSGHMPALGWLLVISDVLVFWIGLGYVCFRLHEAREKARLRAEASGAASVGHLADVSGAGAAAAANDLSAGAAPLGS